MASIYYIIIAALPIAIGYFIADLCIAGRRKAIAVFAGIPLGFAFLSLLSFITFIFQLPSFSVTVTEVMVMALLAWNYYGRYKKSGPDQEKVFVAQGWIPWVITILFWISVLNSSYNYIVKSWQAPHGGGDAYMNWNVKARIMFAAEPSQWQLMFEKNYNHPDYPLMVPGVISGLWKIAGDESVFAMILVHFLFAVAVAGLLYTSLQSLKSKLTAQLATIFVMCTPFFIMSATHQFADLPLSVFYLLSFILLTMATREDDSKRRSRLFALLGISSSMSMWVKNEGLVFFMILLFCIVAASFFYRQTKSMITPLMYFAAGAAVFFILTVCFRTLLVPPNDLVVVEEGTTLSRFTDLSRYAVVAKSYFSIGTGFGQWWITPLPAAVLYMSLTGWNGRTDGKSIVMISLTLAIILIAYFFIYIGFYFEYISTSMDRLFLQVFPSMLFLFCLMIKTPEEALGMPQKEK